VLIGYAGCGSRTKSTEKSADLHQAAENSVEIYRSGDFSPAHRPLGSRHLAVSNGRLPDPVSGSLLMLKPTIREILLNLHVFSSDLRG
jgi:hypothetical protein